MSARRESVAFAAVLGLLVSAFLCVSLFGNKVLSPADVLFVSASFRDVKGPGYEPSNRLLMDPVLQFQPWIEFNRAMLRRGRLPLWNDLAGCGVPHLANAQSAPFDPIHAIAYLGPLPQAHAWMAAARLWLAGLGMFLVARSWGLGPWGRWFAGLCYPFCGFVVLWLLFPVTSVAVWMPWLFWASDRVFDQATPRNVGALALLTGFAVLGGHIQTTAQVLLAVGVYAVWRAFRREVEGGLPRPGLRPLMAWSGGLALGLGIGSVTIVPLGAYLAKSPVWEDRARECPSPLTISRPRLLDAVCTVIPYAFGSQRAGHPNLARGLGVHNLNESAGGYAGLATALWLAPSAWFLRHSRPRVVFLSGLGSFGFLAAFGFPPAVNLLRALPVLSVVDQRRLTLWVAFALVLLGGMGLDSLPGRLPSWRMRWWASLWVAGGLTLLVVALAVPRARPWLESRAKAHYRSAASATEGADAGDYLRRAERQVEATLAFVPSIAIRTACGLFGLAALSIVAGQGSGCRNAVRGILAVGTVAELFLFGYGINPSIEPSEDRPMTAVVKQLRKITANGSGRMLGLGQEWPPNVAMRYGLADVRNYDSVELTRSLDWFEPLYEPGPGSRSSRRTVSWAGVLRARDRLREAGVSAVVASSPPPDGLGAPVERVGSAWVARLDALPAVTRLSTGEGLAHSIDHGHITIQSELPVNDRIVVRVTFDPGWKAEADGRPLAVEPYRGTFLSVDVPAGARRVTVDYDPPEVRVACVASVVSLAASIVALAGFVPRTVPPEFCF
jgi:hypothetical protein